MSTFDEATAIVPAGEHRWTSPLDAGWFGAISPHGGHLAAQLLRAACREVDDPTFHPRTLTVHYTSRGAPGQLEVETALERQGRSVQTVSVRGTQHQRLIAVALLALTADRPGPELLDAAMPEVPGPDDMPGPWARVRRAGSPLGDHYELRPCIGQAHAGDVAELGGWVRLKEDRPPDELLLAALTDIWMPAVMARLPERLPCTTVELTVNFMERPNPGDEWFLVVFRCPTSQGGYFREDGQVWSQAGRLLAVSSQLAVFTHSA